jgi:hypothetical protein
VERPYDGRDNMSEKLLCQLDHRLLLSS